MALERAFPNLNFESLTNIIQPDDGSGRVFVTEQTGTIRTFQDDQSATEAPVFLDLSDKVITWFVEEGLLGLVFDPEFEENGEFYVYYSAGPPRRSVVSRFTVREDDPSRADPNSETIVFELEQPDGWHNGGQLAFGPDGYLYVGLGDGGGLRDAYGNGQDTTNLFGTILRLDVRNRPQGGYAVPSDNPFVGKEGARPEIWAYGFRNPWRFSFDDAGRLWVADVGEHAWEEINIVEKGKNYGWSTMEGPECADWSEGCDQSGLELPLYAYDHTRGCALAGGQIYQGDRLPGLRGTYLFADYCSSKVWGIRSDGERVTEEQLLSYQAPPTMTSVGRTLDGEVYFLTAQGEIYRLVEK